MSKRILVICAAIFFIAGLSSCGKTKACAAYSKVPVEKSCEVES